MKRSRSSEASSINAIAGIAALGWLEDSDSLVVANGLNIDVGLFGQSSDFHGFIINPIPRYRVKMLSVCSNKAPQIAYFLSAMSAAILLLESNDVTLLEVMAEAIDAFCHRETVKARDLAELMVLNGSALACEAAFLDINLGPDRPSGIDAYNWLRAQGFEGRIYFFTGHAHTHPLVRKALEPGDVKLLSKPIDLGSLVRIIDGGA